MAATRRATARWMPATTRSRGTSWARRLITSLSANTVHMLDISTGSAPSESAPSAPTSVSRAPAITSRKRPVPAAHLSFMEKSTTPPAPSVFITLLSWPPMSMTMSVPGTRNWAPLAWQVISVTFLSANPTWPRP